MGARSTSRGASSSSSQLLATADGRVLEREEIYQRVWGYTMAHGDRSVDVFVRKLRSKFQQVSPDYNYIHTHFGVGYRFSAERAGEQPALVPLRPAPRRRRPCRSRRPRASRARRRSRARVRLTSQPPGPTSLSSMSLETARNVGIIVLLGLVVWLAPGGGEGASFISQLLNAIFIVADGARLRDPLSPVPRRDLLARRPMALRPVRGRRRRDRDRVGIAPAVRDRRRRDPLVRARSGPRRTRCTSSGSATARTPEPAPPARFALTIARRLSQTRVEP